MKHYDLALKRLFLLIMTVIAVGIVFGIGINYGQAASSPENLQPATGQNEYREMDGTTPATHATEGNVGSTNESSAEHSETAGTEDAGIVGMFGLNWKLFLAQLVNFGIILFVLWKWVFGPVTKGLSQRTEKIESSLADAQKIAEERETFDSWKQGEISQVRTEAAGIITQAKVDAEKLKESTLTQTKDEQAKLIASAQAKLEQEKQAMLTSVKTELAELVVSATENLLKQKLDPKKDAALIEQALSEAKKAGGSA